jgi:hypothetical protein
MLCKYGCGREGKYLIEFKSGAAWCCEERWRKCPNLNKEETRQKISRRVKGIKRSKKTRTLLSIKAKERYKNIQERVEQSERMRKIWSDPKRREDLSERQKSRFSDPLERNRHSKILKEVYKKPEVYAKTKRTIEKIKSKYQIFFNEEEMRYNPDRPDEKVIQVHCKNHKCENSKEKGGWFTPTGRQIEFRIFCLENVNGNDGGYFYCSDACKLSCCLYRFREDPNRLTDFEKYSRNVERETRKSIAIFGDNIENINLRSREFPLDHRYSIHEGFNNGVDPSIIGHWANLRIVTVRENSRKQSMCSISLDQLKEKILDCQLGQNPKRE